VKGVSGMDRQSRRPVNRGAFSKTLSASPAAAASRKRTRILPKPFVPQKWYPAEEAKRNISKICSAVAKEGSEDVYVSGTEDEPMYVIANAAKYDENPNEVRLSQRELFLNWPSVLAAMAAYDTQFCVHAANADLVILHKRPGVQHPVERYRKSSSPEIAKLVQTLEDVIGALRKLEKSVELLVTGRSERNGMGTSKLEGLVGRLERTAGIIDHRFQQLWRISDGRHPNLSIH
jgi:hypothetical protein